jgi:pimeloyl-ACP methyl ester carboxylesterase
MTWRTRNFNDTLNVEVFEADQDSETIVFIAGLGGTTRYWGPRIEPLLKRYRIVLVDLLGFGLSPKPWTKYDVARHLDSLNKALSDFERFTIVGHSLGALLAIAYAAENPTQVNNIVALSLPRFEDQDSAYRYFRQKSVKGGFLFTNIVLTTLTCVLSRRVFGRILPYVVRSLPREVVEDLVQHTWRSSTSSLWEVVYRYNVEVDLLRLPNDIAIQFIHGDMDVTAPVEPIQELVEHRSNWKLDVLPGLDHHPFLKAPDACLRLITSVVEPAIHDQGQMPSLMGNEPATVQWSVMTR